MTNHQSPINDRINNDLMTNLVIGTCELVIATEGSL